MHAVLVSTDWAAFVGLAETSMGALSFWSMVADTWADAGLTAQELLRQLLSVLYWVMQLLFGIPPQGLPRGCYHYRRLCTHASAI